VDAFDDQHLPVFFDFAPGLGGQQPLTGWNLARFQRTAKRAGQSACCRCNHIVQGGGMRLVNIGIHSVVFGYFRMNTKHNRIFHLGQIGPPQWSLYPFNSGFRCINNLIAHNTSFNS